MTFQSKLQARTAALFAIALSAHGCSAYLPKADVVTQQSTHINRDALGFVVIGDTGVLPPEGNLEKTTGALTGYCADQADCSFVLLTGDNVYPKGATANPVADAKTFESVFIKPFANFSLQNPQSPIILALGNHDWYTSREGALAQVAFHEKTRPFFMDGLFYKKRVSDSFGGVDVFVIDTEMLLSPETLDHYDKDDNGHMIPDGKSGHGGTQNALPVTDAEKNQLSWLEAALKSSDARWKFIVAHHPLWQGRPDSKYTQSIRLREMLLPMACRYADAYFAGHQHTIEVHEDDCSTVAATDGRQYAPLPVIVSGAGAKERSVDLRFSQWQSAKFPQNTVRVSWGESAGFVHVSLTKDALSVVPVVLDESGNAAPKAQITYAERDDH